MADRASTLGERIYNERLKRGWSQGRVARHFGTNQSSASRWERDELLPGEEHIAKLAEWLNFPQEEIRALKHNLKPPSVAISELSEALERLADSLERRMERLERLVADATGVCEVEAPEFRSDAPESED